MMGYGYYGNGINEFFGGCRGGYFGYGMDYFGRSPFMLMFLAGVVVLAVFLVVFAVAKSRGHNVDGDNAAAEALKMRYVNGEITEEEYKKMKKNLR